MHLVNVHLVTVTDMIKGDGQKGMTVICSGLRVCSFKACKSTHTHTVSVKKESEKNFLC